MIASGQPFRTRSVYHEVTRPKASVEAACAGYSRTSVWVMVYLTLTLNYPSGTPVPFPDDCGGCSLWVSSFWGRLFD